MSLFPRLTLQASRGGSRQVQGPILSQYLSTSASSNDPSNAASLGQSSSSSSSRSPLPPPVSDLSWDRYLSLRKQRRTAGVLTTIPTTALAALSSGSYFLTQEIDPTSTILGIDPVYVSLIETVLCAGMGYLVGPTIGASLWSVFHSKQRKEIEQKDQDFYRHISSMRGDPSRQTMQNRPPDYYGEKIGSIKEYRQWLRDQAAYRRKAAHGVDDDEKTL